VPLYENSYPLTAWLSTELSAKSKSNAQRGLQRDTPRRDLPDRLDRLDRGEGGAIAPGIRPSRAEDAARDKGYHWVDLNTAAVLLPEFQMPSAVREDIEKLHDTHRKRRLTLGEISFIPNRSFGPRAVDHLSLLLIVVNPIYGDEIGGQVRGPRMAPHRQTR
jgi:hypothetical protein